MKDTRLIIVEGLPASGKSTTAARIAALLAGQGKNVRVFIFLGGFLFTNRWFPKIYQKKRRWFLLQTTFFYVTMTDREFLFSNRWFL